ncbi:MAG TPA: ATP-binding cassette domain-containing protein [Acidimicrobiales bacterium]|nr:ATP-binding cassette domain-containing protein [Acidimicrobiales bacterium]
MYDSPVQPTNNGRAGGVRAAGLGKRYGDLWALRDLHLDVPAGTVLGLLGHNGAGKTTAIRILTTLTSPTTGQASVAGLDVVHDAAAVRERIGVAAQQATVDGLLTARANLEMVGRLHHLSRNTSRVMANELLELLDLTDAATKLAKNLSGGMRRRLDLAASLVASPEVLFLDEPTTGLDPRGRADLWSTLRELVRDGTTIVLTTQYLEEADRLADEIVVLDHGRTVAKGTPAELKARIGDDRFDVTVATQGDLVAAASVLAPFVAYEPTLDSDALVVSAPIVDGTRLIDVVRALDEAGIDAVDVNRRQSSLDDVFLTLTTLVDETAGTQEALA